MTLSARRTLVIEVRLLSGRFHGVRRVDLERGEAFAPEWPPSPFRLFQALVAGSYGGRWALEDAGPKDAALQWLEALDAPVVAAPVATRSPPLTLYVPNNDLDSVGGDPDRTSEIRVAKRRRASVVDRDQPVVYAWTFDDAPPHHAEVVCRLAERLHTLGHGIDCAYATAAVLDVAEGRRRLADRPGTVRRPGAPANGAHGTPCPSPGSLASLKRRHDALRQRFRLVHDSKKSTVEFRQPPRAHLRWVGYGNAPDRMLFELRDAVDTTHFLPKPHTQAPALVKCIRDQVYAVLADALPDRRSALERAIVGRGDPAPEPSTRMRFIPLPSIGVAHTSPSIRRLLVELPSPATAVTLEELRWALAGRVFGGKADAYGVLRGQTLLSEIDGPVAKDAMAARYLQASALWRSMTPVVLPLSQRTVGQPDGTKQISRLGAAADAVVRALDHAGVPARVVSLRLQKEPWHRRGRHAGDHDADRFGSARLFHLELRLDRPVPGPLVLGDGRWLGLGLMVPVTDGPPGLHVFDIESRVPDSTRAPDLSRALRRAVMALVQAALGPGRELPLFFSGHGPEGEPAADERHQHLFYLADDANGDGRPDRLAVVAPTLPASATPAEAHEHRRHLETLAAALRPIRRLVAGASGVLMLRSASVGDADPLFGAGRAWTSRTAYWPTRQPKRMVVEAIEDDLRRECARHRLPVPTRVEVLGVDTGPRGRVTARVRLRFAVSVDGPLLLGKGAHFGCSLFEREGPRSKEESEAGDPA